MSRERNNPRKRDEQWDEYEYGPDYEDEAYEELPRRRKTQRQPSARPTRSLPPRYRSPAPRLPYPSTSRSSPTRPSPARTSHPQSHQRSGWSTLLTGCAIGVALAVLAVAIFVMTGIYSLQNGKLSIPVITSASRTITTEKTLTVPLNTISQIVVCDIVGDVIVKADPTIHNPTVTITKQVQASSQAEADQQFQHMAVTVQPPDTITGPLPCTRFQATTTANNTSSNTTTADGDTSNTLTANVTFSSQLNNASVDLTIAIPSNILPTIGPSTIVNIESAGNISVDGISGVLNIKGDSGNPQNSDDIKVTHAALADGSRLSTSGAITFNGYLAKAADPSKTAFYTLEGEKQIDVTLPSNTNVTLEAYAVSGSINSQFPLQQNLLQKDKDMIGYHGPLNSSAGPAVNAQLTLHVGIGNVNINQAQAPAV